MLWRWVILLMVGCATVGRANSFRFTQISWNSSDRLAEDEVNDIHQTSDGYVWIATRGGLSRFDGVRFENYNHLTHPEFTSDVCEALGQDSEGNLWVITSREVLKARDGGFVKVRTLQEERTFPMAVRTHGGATWLMFGGAIGRVAAGRFEEHAYNMGHSFPRELSVLLPLNADAAIFGTPEEGLATVHFGRGVSRIAHPEMESYFALAIERVETEVFFVLCGGAVGAAGIPYKLTGGTNWTRLSAKGVVTSRHRYFAKRDAFGAIWMPNEDHLEIYQEGAFATQRVVYPAGPHRDVALCAMHDREHNVWVGMERSGLHLLKRQPFRAASLEGMVNSNTWAFLETPRETLLVGTDGGLAVIRTNGHTMIDEGAGLSRNDVRALAQLEGDEILVGTGNGLSRVNLGSGEVERFRFDPRVRHDSDEHQISGNKVRALAVDVEGALWVATYPALFRIHGGETNLFDSQNSVVGNDVRSLLVDGKGTLWLGGIGAGLCRWEGTKFQQVTNGLSDLDVWALHEDEDGLIWMATEKGLNCLRFGRIHSFTATDGLPVEKINAVISDGLGHLWITHDHGLFALDRSELMELMEGGPRALQALTFDESDGMPSRETNGQKSQPSALKRKNGELLFATVAGPMALDPAAVRALFQPPLGVIESVRANGAVVYEHRPETRRRQLKFAPGAAEMLEFHFNALAFSAPQKSRFEYRLRGFNQKWVDGGSRRVATFTRLPPGPFEFELRAANHRNIWSEPVSIGFVIQPQYYQTAWFWALVALAVSLVLWAAHHLRLRHHNEVTKLRAELALAEERTRISRDLHDGVGQIITYLSFITEFAAKARVSPGEMDAQLEQIRRTTQELSGKVKEIVWLGHPNSQRLEALVDQVCARAEQLMQAKGVRRRFEIGDLQGIVLSPVAAHNLYLAALEALHNVAKHADAKCVYIAASVRTERFVLTVRDDGRGSNYPVEKGIGLASMRARMSSIGGAMEIEADGTGTRLTLQMPLARNQVEERP